MQRSPLRPVTFPRLNPEFYALDLPQAALTAAVFLPRVEALFPSTSIAVLSHRPLHIAIVAAIVASAVHHNSSATSPKVPQQQQRHHHHQRRRHCRRHHHSAASNNNRCTRRCASCSTIIC